MRKQAKSNVAPSSHQIDFKEAISRHLQWKTNLRNAALHNEPLDVETIRRDDCCPLGKWLHGDAQSKWRGQPRFVELLDRHKAFHCEAAEVAQAFNPATQRPVCECWKQTPVLQKQRKQW